MCIVNKGCIQLLSGIQRHRVDNTILLRFLTVLIYCMARVLASDQFASRCVLYRVYSRVTYRLCN